MLFRFLQKITTFLFIVFVLYAIVSLRVYRVEGDSMLPRLKPGMLVLIDRVSTKISPLHQGEIVVYRDGQNGVRIKRTIGLPYENIEISRGMVFRVVNGSQNPLKEDYLEEHVRTCVPGACINTDIHTYTVPENHYFVLGDNRMSSRDSRGCRDVSDCTNTEPYYIPQEEVIGRVIFAR